MNQTLANGNFRNPFAHIWPFVASTWLLWKLRLSKVLGNLRRSSNVKSLPDVQRQHADPKNDVSIRLLKNDDREWKLWWETAGKLLALQLYYSRYRQEARERSLDFFQQNVLPYLGAFPTAATPRRWRSFMTDDHTPLELSWDWGNGSRAPQVRYSVDPISLDSGTHRDPTNLTATTHFYEDVIRRIPGVNLVWHDHFAQWFESFENGSSERNGRWSRVFYAFDVRCDGDTVPKAYFFPRFVLSTTPLETSVWGTVNDAIEKAPLTSPADLQVLAVLSAFFKEQCQLTVEMLSIDLLEPQASRIKVYFRSPETDCESLTRNMTLNHRIKEDLYLKGVKNLIQLWKRIFDLSEGKEVKRNAQESAGVLYYTDFRLRDKLPKVKVYIPVGHFAASDEKIVSTLSKYLEEIGQDQFTSAYREVLKETFSPTAMKESRGLHTYIGCSIGADGSLQLISYVNPQVEKML